MAGLVSTLYHRIALLHPRIEVILRQIYWHNSKCLGRFNPNKESNMSIKDKQLENVDFDSILEQLRDWGVKDGSLLIVHSSYDSLKATGLTPLEIIVKLKNLIGETGTLAMPVIRSYKEEPDAIQKLQSSYRPPKCTYNPRRTPVSSGLLPTFLMRMSEAEISLHPLNPLCAVGPLAKDMMRNNISGTLPSPHGKDSSWKFCLDNNAIVIGLGTDLKHHNTIGHVAEEAYGDWYWNDEDWYNKRDFVIQKSKQESVEITVRERKPLWGMLHQAELNRYNDLIKNNVLMSRLFGNVLLELEASQDLIKFLRSKNKNGYPYFK
ncbi:AAC(3) family N-acetyltransferase [uncultured Butyricimonas sp.]|uniref:AAC(3) family N-acetyltransferase n=1 Tax=uncultured Butyricimonas sp. TaxID=1268785 RepID=UPI0026DD7F97|nr:AAC(3) family N-acetyltransferase [uncultured Butyricimonas sp.]